MESSGEKQFFIDSIVRKPLLRRKNKNSAHMGANLKREE
jgi:hypothetical protein